MSNRPYCLHDGCLQKSVPQGKGWCSMHYNRQKRGKPMDGPNQRTGTARKTCTITGCHKPLKSSQGMLRSKSLCAMHFSRSWRIKKGLTSVAMDAPYQWEISRAVTYLAAHVRVRREWGPATLYACAKCGAPASDWAYDGTDETQLLGIGSDRSIKRLSWYSRYPEFYMPLCRKCHGQRDGRTAADELNNYRKQLSKQNNWTVVE
jgi:hypothetical protein